MHVAKTKLTSVLFLVLNFSSVEYEHYFEVVARISDNVNCSVPRYIVDVSVVLSGRTLNLTINAVTELITVSKISSDCTIKDKYKLKK